MKSVQNSVSKSVFAAVHNPLKVPAALVGGSAGVSFDFFVDSAGSDANDGLTPATAKQTIAAAMSLLSPGKKLGFARGSKWRETFTFQHASVTCGVYGTGDPPILDGRDIATGWTQHDAGTYPDVWNVTWTRSQAATTGVAWVNLWEDNEFVRAATSIADCQTNGGAFYTSRTALTTTIYLKSTTNPNTNGKTYEISKRGWGFKGHSTSLGISAPANQQITGPFELTGFIEHYNAVSGGPGQSKQFLATDGNVHHTVTEGDLSEDVLLSRVIPGALGALHTAYRVVGTGFNHTARRCLAMTEIFQGSGRSGHGGFYCHGTTPATIDSFTIDQCLLRMCSCSGDTAAFTVTNLYAEGMILPVIGASATNQTININRVQMQDTTLLAGMAFRCLTNVPVITIGNFCAQLLSGTGMNFHGLPSTPPNVSNIALVTVNAGISGTAGNAASLTLNNSIVMTTGGRPLSGLATPYAGNFNVFRGVGDNAPVFGINGFTDSSLAAWQTRTGQDAQSVWLKGSDQTAGNANAFWLGVSTNTNAGPADGDWRINPSARVYNAAGTGLTGTFADGTTPITAAGPQEHWNYNTRAVVAGPPARLLTLPATKAEERQYINDPAAWDFYA